MDAPFYITLPLRSQLKTKVEDASLWGSGAGPEGCDDVRLYRRFKASNLTDIKMFPYWVVFGETWLDFAQATVMRTLEAASFVQAPPIASRIHFESRRTHFLPFCRVVPGG